MFPLAHQILLPRYVYNTATKKYSYFVLSFEAKQIYTIVVHYDKICVHLFMHNTGTHTCFCVCMVYV